MAEVSVSNVLVKVAQILDDLDPGEQLRSVTLSVWGMGDQMWVQLMSDTSNKKGVKFFFRHSEYEQLGAHGANDALRVQVHQAAKALKWPM